MFHYVASRFVQGVLTLILVSIGVFILTRSTGNPAVLNLPATATNADIARMTTELGLNRPIWYQYIVYIGNLLHGNLGESIRYQVPVSQLLAERSGASFQLAALAAVVAIVLTYGLGTIAALSGGVVERAVDLLSLTGISLPAFWVGIVAIQVFALRLHLLPVAGQGSLANLVLPVLTLSLFITGGMTRLLHTGVTEVLESAHIRSARARGITPLRVVADHVLRNASLPVVGYLGAYLPLLVSSAVVVETVFAWPGLGSLAYDSVVSRDFPVIQGVTLLGAVLVVVANLVADLVIAALDPRIRDGISA